MGLIELIKIAFADDYEIFLPIEYENQHCIYEPEEKSGNSNLRKIREIVSNGLPSEPEGEAPKFNMNGSDE